MAGASAKEKIARERAPAASWRLTPRGAGRYMHERPAMFKVSLFADRAKPVAERCRTDASTRLRLKYAPYYNVVEQADGVHIVVNGRQMVMMSSNEYLGLTSHPEVRRAAKEAIDQWGTSPCGSRLANGTRAYHVELEDELAAFLGKEACHVSVPGTWRASRAFPASRSARTCCSWTRASTPRCGTACASAARRWSVSRTRTCDPGGAARPARPRQPKIIVVDGVYSMEGHIASLPRIVALAEEHRAFFVVDDCHGFGVLGRDGRGVADHFGLTDKVDLIAAVFPSRSPAPAASSRRTARPSNTCAPTAGRSSSARRFALAAAAALASLRVMQREPEHRARLWENTRYLAGHPARARAGFLGQPDARRADRHRRQGEVYFIWQSLREQGFFTVMSISPGVPAGQDLIRTSVTALHTKEMLDRFGDALKVAIKKAGFKPRAATV